MPNQPKTPLRSVRVPDELWNAALAKARSEGLSLTAVVRMGLQQFVTGD